jgi:epoxide hydrolase
MSITPYTIAIPQADLDDLKARLAHVRWTNELPGVGTDYGVSLDSVKRLVKYWQEGYDWRIWEAKLNAYPSHSPILLCRSVNFERRNRHLSGCSFLLTLGVSAWPDVETAAAADI